MKYSDNERARWRRNSSARSKSNSEISRTKNLARVGRVIDKVEPECAAARLAEIPRDDPRDLTGRTFGDPHPLRSALANRNAGAPRGKP